jgi:hypothetical protein
MCYVVNPGEADPGEVQSKPLPLRALLTPKVSTVTASYAIRSLFHIAFDSVIPVFYATPIELVSLSLGPPRIGAILAASMHQVSHMSYFSWFSTFVYMVISVRELSMELAPAYPSSFYFQ